MGLCGGVRAESVKGPGVGAAHRWPMVVRVSLGSSLHRVYSSQCGLGPRCVWDTERWLGCRDCWERVRWRVSVHLPLWLDEPRALFSPGQCGPVCPGASRGTIGQWPWKGEGRGWEAELCHCLDCLGILASTPPPVLRLVRCPSAARVQAHACRRGHEGVPGPSESLASTSRGCWS